MRLAIIVGTRPNFIKITQFPRVLKGHQGIEYKIIHTGQHHSQNMSSVFFSQFGFEPDHNINLIEKTPVSIIGEIMIELERYFREYKPDLVLVAGDVNSTLAGALVANKMEIALAHLESGLRSGDRSMPEEINRVLTDEITDEYFVTEQSGIENLKNEGVENNKIHFVGNTMIDTLVAFKDQISSTKILEKYDLEAQNYVLVTMHRPATVDTKEGLQKLISILKEISNTNRIVFPIHPRTLKNISKFLLEDEFSEIENLTTCEPLDYFTFQNLIANSKFLITDSGGIQEETTFYRIPCITLRPNTERPSTVNIGSNTLINFDYDSVMKSVSDIEKGQYKKGEIPPLWDGKSTERIVKILSDKYT